VRASSRPRCSPPRPHTHTHTHTCRHSHAYVLEQVQASAAASASAQPPLAEQCVPAVCVSMGVCRRLAHAHALQSDT
jgi:hypothetical protein